MLKFKDFDAMTPAVQEIIAKYPGIEIEDAYVLAKGKVAGKNPPAKKVETEKPETHLGRQNTEDDTSAMSKAEKAAARKEEEKGAMRPSKSGRSFRQMVEDAYEKGKTEGWTHEGYSSTEKED